MRSVQDLLSQFFDQTQLNQAQKTNTFFSAWTEIAGKDLAAHSKIYDISKGTVLVSVDHPGWMQMIQLQKRPILTCLKSTCFHMKNLERNKRTNIYRNWRIAFIFWQIIQMRVGTLASSEKDISDIIKDDTLFSTLWSMTNE